MSGIERGLYETLITEALELRLKAAAEKLVELRAELRPAEAADRIALHIGRIVQRAVQGFSTTDRVALGIALARRLVAEIDGLVTDSEARFEAPVLPGTVLRALRGKRPDGTPEVLSEPLIPLLDTALLTNAPGEPRVGSQILAEICSADRIDVVMAFIRRSGIAPLLDALRQHCSSGRPLRVLTTTFTGTTEARALDELKRIGADVRVSYDETMTRLHAKAWLLHRASSFSTAYIGSSNLTHSAQVTGLEWNVRVSGARNPDVIGKMGGVFEAYWNGGDFVPYDAAQFAERRGGVEASGPRIFLSPVELRPEPFQERLLEQIALSRERGHHRNLLVSATGTGKTVMAAIDYARLRVTLPRARLLFVAHRKEILDQSLATFRYALRDPAFGESWHGGERPVRFEHVFASIQSLRRADLKALDPHHFDVVVVDEFHHAAAPSYRTLLERMRPVELLGLTATPERSDGLPLLDWFDGRIAAELRLWDAIDQHRLSPFVYYGVADGIDLRGLTWRRGHGYDLTELSNLITGDEAGARLVIKQLADRVDDVSKMRALGFCVSISHARFMAKVFSAAGIAAVAVWADSTVEERAAALADLGAGRVNVLFSVDLFNEGVDLPTVDTLLFLRPTDSPTLFLQQLGRGLRKSLGKATCTVLDFVGLHRKEFRFDRRFRALLGGTRQDLTSQVEAGFPFLPAGCHIELDAVAKERVLANIRAAIPSGWTARVEELRQLAKTGRPVTIEMYLEETGLELADLYTGGKSWSDLCDEAGVPVLPSGPDEGLLRRACGRLLHVDDVERIELWRTWLAHDMDVQPGDLSPRPVRLLRMLVASVAGPALDKSASLQDGVERMRRHPQVRAELLQLLNVLGERVSHVHPRWIDGADVPLQVHARYTRIEILAALGVGAGAKVAPWQSGVYWAPDARTDVFAFTLDKTSGQFSPTTSYKDRAISRDLIHWESQSTTRQDSETGLRYQHHAAGGTSVLLFARLRADDRAFWFLGPASYVSHESEMPMEMTWRLHHALPGDLFASFAAAVA